MPPPPADGRPRRILGILFLVALVSVASAGMAWRHVQEHGPYDADLARTVRKYGRVAAVPPASLEWLAREHSRPVPEVKADLAAVATRSFGLGAEGWEETMLFARFFANWSLRGFFCMAAFWWVGVRGPGNIYMTARGR